MGAARNVVHLKEMQRVAERIAAKSARGEKFFPKADSGLTEVADGSNTDVGASLFGDIDDIDDNESGAQKRIQPPAESGVRASNADFDAAFAARNMSFTVYKLEDLDARARISTPPSVPPPAPSRWPLVWTSANTLLTTFLAWRKELVRPKLQDALSIPAATLRVDLVEALKELPWKKIGIYGGGMIGGFLFLLFAVVTIADITDDLKPAHDMHVTSDVVAPAPPTPSAPAAEAPAAPADPAPAIEIELDDGPSAAAATPTKKPAAKHGKKKKKPVDLFNP